MNIGRDEVSVEPRRGRARATATGQRLSRAKALLIGALVAGLVVPFMATSIASVAGATTAPARSAGVNQGGFPLWYQDANGVRVVPCLDPAETNCLAPLVGPTYDPALPLSYPSNYPDEFFYSVVDAQTTPVADCAVTAGDGVTVTLALEASFLSGDPRVGDRATFGRIRLGARGGSGLCGNTWYTFRTPYGPTTLKTPSNGEIKGGFASSYTTDIGCAPTPALPCDFDAAFAAPVLRDGLLRQAAGAVPGYLGSTSFAPITGGKNDFNRFEIVKWPAGTAPSTDGYGVDCVLAGCAVLGQTSNFNVLAKLAGPLTSDVAGVDFGGQGELTTSAPRTITVTNLGSGPLGLDPTAIDHVVITGTDAAQFALTTTSCSVGALTAPVLPTPLDRDALCGIDVTFTPAAVASASATLEVWPVGAAAPLTVTLVGTGITVDQAPAAAVDPADLVLAIGDVRVTTASVGKSVTVTNTGNAPLQVLPAIATSAQSSLFSINANSCPTGVVAPGAACTIGVTFVPQVAGPATAQLDITTNLTATPIISITMNANGTGGVAAVSTNLIDGFPEWYQDERGVRLAQCADPANALCITGPIAAPLSFPTSYPDEAFYYLATSDDVVIDDPQCDTGEGALFVETGVEQAFATPTVQDGQQMTFGRIRFVAGRKGGLCADTSYVVTYPYGRDIITTDADGAVKPAAGTTDVGCVGAPCNFSLAIAASVFEGFLQQTQHPAGYLGNPLQSSTVTGSPFIDPDTLQPANHVTVRRLDTPGTLLGSTTLFGVSGRLAGPMVASPAVLSFGSVDVASGTASASTTFTNFGQSTVTLGGSPFSVSGTGDFTVGATTCSADLPLPSGATCTVEVVFDPSTTGARSADLVLHHDGQNDPLTVPLSGIGLAPVGQPAISVQPASITFTPRHIDTVSESQVITVSNLGGSAPLTVSAATVTAGQPYFVTNGCELPVDPDMSCAIAVRFAPSAAGSFPASVTIVSDAGTVTVALSGSATTANPSTSGATSTAGFPLWIQDTNGVRLEQCLSTDGCLLAGGAGFDPTQPIAFPGNYPGESFYSLADSEPVSFGPQACSDGSQSAGGTAFVRLVTEAAFTTPTPTPGGQLLFNRIRIKADGLCPGEQYGFVQPYGTSFAQIDVDGTLDITFDSPANVVTTTDPVLGGFLRWDPNVAPAAPAGRLGDGASFHKVVGSNYRDVPGGEPVNSFRIVGSTGIVAGQTDRFLVVGSLVGPVVSNTTSIAFGSVRQSRTGTAQNVVVSNLGPTPVSNFAVALGGANAAAFTIVNNGCAGVTLAIDASCTVRVNFAPSATEALGAKTATLTVGHDGLRSPVTVSLSGTVITSAVPALAVTPASLAFGSIAVGATSATQTVTVRNSGTAPMRLSGLAIGGANGDQFRFVGSSSATACPITGVAATANINGGATCTFTVAFRPTLIGTKAASIVVGAIDPATSTALTPITVTLGGTATQGTITLSAATVNISGRAGRTATATLKITNTGTANFSLTGAPLFWDPATGLVVTTRFAATNTCTNVAPRRTCSVTISFTPGAGTVGQVYTTDLYLFSNASNTVVDPRTGATVRGVKVRVIGTRTR